MDLVLRRAITSAIAALAVICAAARLGAQAAPPAPAAESGRLDRAKIVDAIVEGCRRIEKTQDEKGGFDLDRNWYHGVDGTGDYGWLEFKVGCTALGTLALKHAIPFLPPEETAAAEKAAKRGFDFVVQQLPENKTYSAGVLLTLLYEDNPQNPKEYGRLISQYATMLALTQIPKGASKGMWSYNLLTPQWMIDRQLVPPGRIVKNPNRTGPPDNSNTQFAVLGLVFAQQSGFQVPREVWERLAEHYLTTQAGDGGWGYYAGSAPSANMTIASTVSLAIAVEMLRDPNHRQCTAPPRNTAVDKGMQWIAANAKFDAMSTYGYYALERLGILMGRSEIGGVDWYAAGAKALAGNRGWGSDNTGNYQGDPRPEVGAAFATLFLARGLEPIIVNKLERRESNDWNNDPYDVKHLVEYVAARFQKPVQWRIVTLDAPVDFLLQVPILFISGHEALAFTDAEKAKLKDYVARGGTILAEACCSKKEFDASLRKLAKELWPESELLPLPRTHQVFVTPKSIAGERLVLALMLEKGQGRTGLLYLPHDESCRWHAGGPEAKAAFDLGANIYFYVTKVDPPAPALTVPPPAPQAPPTAGEPKAQDRDEEAPETR